MDRQQTPKSTKKGLPGKTVADEFYIHLSALDQVDHPEARLAMERAVQRMPTSPDEPPNVAKFNLRTGRVSLLAYPDFFAAPFPALSAAWIFPSGAQTPVSFRCYGNSLNPPILHRKELLLPSSHPQHSNWARLTATAEGLGLFDDAATIGFRLNWTRLIASKGYQLVGDEFVPLGNAVLGGSDFEPDVFGAHVQRHLTALVRSNLSAPVQLLIRHGLLQPGRTFFDYGCGRGGDMAALTEDGFEVKGWDPHYLPDEPVIAADIVNLGFVVNVIEDPAERIEALAKAFRLARTAMSVGVMLYGGEAPGRPYRDGFLTSRNTFQKYFSQSEFKDYLEQALHREAFMVGPGVAIVFAESEAEQRFSAGRYRSRGVAARLLAARVPRPKPIRELRPVREHRPERQPRVPRLSRAEQQLTSARPVLDQLWAAMLNLGRQPELDEVTNLAEVDTQLGGLSKALRLIARHYDQTLLDAAARTRADDVQMFMATQQFAKRPAYRRLEQRLQRDIKAFFGDYRSAQAAGLTLLVEAADPARILSACQAAATRGLGWIEAEHSLQLHVSMIERLPAVLRAYVTCGLILWDSLSEVQLVKIHIGSGKLTLMEFEGFDDTPLPLLRRRIKVNVRKLDYDVFEYGSTAYPKPTLYRKSRFLHEDYSGYADQLAFDDAFDRTGILGESDYGPPSDRLAEQLSARRLAIVGMRVARSESIPDLDAACGVNFTYRSLIECGETQQRLGIANVPLNPATYNALYDLACEILDPAIEYFGSIRLTYAFASPGLTKHIGRGIAPKLDQHSACEHSAKGAVVCDRGGAACDFIVDDEDMREVADWVIGNLPFDRLYFYGSDRPIHISYSETPVREAYQMIEYSRGRLTPRPYKT